MSAVRLVYRFADGDSLSVSVDASDGYPDGLAEARANALALFRDALGVSVETLGEGEDDGTA